MLDNFVNMCSLRFFILIADISMSANNICIKILYDFWENLWNWIIDDSLENGIDLSIII